MSNVKWHEVAPSVWIGDAAGFHESTDPIVTILGGVHGDEKTGIQVVRESLDNLNLDFGRVILGLGNTAAMEARDVNGMPKPKRYIKHNMNRNFVDLPEDFDLESLSPEQQRAQMLMRYLRDSHALLDLHDFTNPRNEPFLITNDVELASKIGAPFISTGWEKTDPGGSDGFMDTLGRKGLCYELGQKNRPTENLQRGHGAVARFLTAMGVQEGKWQPMFDNPVFVHNERAYKYEGGVYKLYIPGQSKMPNFTELETGQPIALINGQTITAQEGQVIIFPTAPKKTSIGEEAFYVGRKFEPAA